MGAINLILGALPGSLIGGFLGDRLEVRIIGIKAYISAFGALISIPFILITFIWQPPFWYAISANYFFAFFSSTWYGPAHAQINNMFPSEF